MVPEKFSDDSLVRLAQHFQDNRLPVVTWKHHLTGAVLLRSSSFLSPPAPKKKPILSKPAEKDQDIVGLLNPDVEAFLSEIVRMSHSDAPDSLGKSLTMSFSRGIMNPLSSFRMSPDIPECLEEEDEEQVRNQSQDTEGGSNNIGESPCSPISPGASSQYRFSLYASSDGYGDYFSGGFQPALNHTLSFEEQPMTLSTSIGNGTNQPMSLYPLTSLSEKGEEEEDDDISVDQLSPNMPDLGTTSQGSMPDIGEVFGRDIGSHDSRGHPHASIATLPTNPRDWVMIDVLPDKLADWQTNSLYVLGDKSVLSNIPGYVYPNCSLIPVEVRDVAL